MDGLVLVVNSSSQLPEIKFVSQKWDSAELLASPNPFCICAAPKTGCTAWKNFFLYVNFGVLLDAKRAQQDPGFVYHRYKKLLGSMNTRGNSSLVNLYEKYDHVM